MQWSRVQELYQLPQWISLRLRNVSNGSHLQGRNGRVLGGRRLLYASEKEQSVPTEGSSTTLLQNMYIPRLSCHPRCLCSCRLIDYSILLKRKKKKKQAEKKKKQAISLFLALFFSLKFVQGDGELFCQNLNGKKKINLQQAYLL